MTRDPWQGVSRVKTIDLSADARGLQDLLRLAGEDNLILRTGDGREFVLAEVDDFEQEISLVRQQPELMALLEQRSRPGRTYSPDEVRKELGLD